MTHVKDIVGPVMLDMLERNCQALEGALTQLVDAIDRQCNTMAPDAFPNHAVREALRHAKVVLGSQP